MEKVMKMEDIKLNPRQERFVKLANDEGFTDKITRKDIENHSRTVIKIINGNYFC